MKQHLKYLLLVTIFLCTIVSTKGQKSQSVCDYIYFEIRSGTGSACGDQSIKFLEEGLLLKKINYDDPLKGNIYFIPRWMLNQKKICIIQNYFESVDFYKKDSVYRKPGLIGGVFVFTLILDRDDKYKVIQYIGLNDEDFARLVRLTNDLIPGKYRKMYSIELL